MAAAAIQAAAGPRLRRASSPIASAVMREYGRFGRRAAQGLAPKSSMGAAANQYVRGGFSQKASPASKGTDLSACQLIRQAMSASRGSSGVQ